VRLVGGVWQGIGEFLMVKLGGFINLSTFLIPGKLGYSVSKGSSGEVANCTAAWTIQFLLCIKSIYCMTPILATFAI